MKPHITLAAGAGFALVLALAAPVAASRPDVVTWTNQVDAPYFDCGTFEAHGVWTVSHELKTFFNGAGDPVRDIEQMSFEGAFVNPNTGASISDSGKVIFFDQLAPDFSYLSTYASVLRRSELLQGRGTAELPGRVVPRRRPVRHEHPGSLRGPRRLSVRSRRSESVGVAVRGFADASTEHRVTPGRHDPAGIARDSDGQPGRAPTVSSGAVLTTAPGTRQP